MGTRWTRLAACLGLLVFLFTLTPTGAQEKQEPIYRKVPAAVLDKILADMGVKIEDVGTTAKGTRVLTFKRGAHVVGLDSYGGGEDLMLYAAFLGVPLEKTNEWNNRAKFSRAHVAAREGRDVTQLEWNLDCTGGVTPSTVVQFIRRFDGELKAFTEFLGRGPDAGPGPRKGLSDQQLLDQVMQRLLAVAASIPAETWPPPYQLVDRREINAFAELRQLSKGGKPFPQIAVTTAMMEVVRSPEDPEHDADRLALILGHELNHILCKHALRYREPGETALVKNAFTRAQELEADRKGMELAVKAGYSFQRGRSVYLILDKKGLNYSSFEGAGLDHPSWSDRLILLDKEAPTFWKAMSAFYNGSYLLDFEQYAAAEKCFRAVTREFPKAYDAWANLGYAQLMQYCDALETKDLRGYGIAHLATGGFSSRPTSLQPALRGIDATLWEEAVHNLKRAVALRPTLSAALGSLGVAYLVHPTAKDVKTAQKYLSEAVAALDKDDTLHRERDLPLGTAVLINAAVAELAAGKRDLASKYHEQAVIVHEQMDRSFGPPAKRTRHLLEGLRNALLYNAAVLNTLDGSKEVRRRAIKQFEEYLIFTSQSSSWWPLGYEQYTKVCKQFDVKTQTPADLVHEQVAELRRLKRPLHAVQLARGITVAVSEPLAEVQRRLGKGREVPAYAGGRLKRVRYPDYGIELLADEQVLAIALAGPKAPALSLKDSGLGTRADELRVGMSRKEFERMLGGIPFELRRLVDRDVGYRFYPQLSLAARIEGAEVRELILVVLPRRNPETIAP